MNDEQILLDDLNAFEDFMENADIEEIKKEHGLTTKSNFFLKEQYPSFELGSYGNSKIVKVTFDSVYVTSKHMAGGVSSIPFDLFSDDYGQYIIAYDNMVRCSGLDISSLPLECVYRLENAYHLRFYKTYLNPVVEVVQGEIVESAEQIHNRICDNFAIVEKTLYEICVDLKSIRDNKHYKTLGYNTFEDYCLENFNIKRRQAYNYISIAENLSSDFVHSSAQFGIKKLYCLSRLTDEERTELVQTTDIEKTTVKELEQKSKEIKENREVQVKENDVVSNVIEPKQIKENTKKDVSYNMALEININPDKPTLTFKDVCSISFESSSLSKGCLFAYDNSCINNDLLSNYDYLTKTFNKLVSGKYDYNNLDTLSDLIEVSRRLADGIYDLKQYLKKKESN